MTNELKKLLRSCEPKKSQNLNIRINPDRMDHYKQQAQKARISLTRLVLVCLDEFTGYKDK